MKFYQFQGLKENVSVEAERLAQIEIAYQRLMQSISECIHHLRSQKYEVRSSISSRLSRSKSSRRSVKSDISKISYAAARKAALKAELKYIDVDTKIKAKLQTSSPKGNDRSPESHQVLKSLKYFE